MKCWMFFLSLCLTINAGCSASAPASTLTVPDPTPTLILPKSPLLPIATVTYESLATGTTKEGQPIVITTVRIVHEVKDTQGNLQGYRTGNKMQVLRANSLFGLKSSNTPNKFGCDIEAGNYDTFGCYFGIAQLVDLDKDGEPEIVTAWEQDGSGGYKSFHLYRWDGSAYQLMAEFFEMQLRFELQDLNQDERPAVILRYEIGQHHWFTVPWVDVYMLSDKRLVSVNSQYPTFYRELLAQYEKMLPEYEVAAGWSSDAMAGLNELERRIDLAQAIVSSHSP